jgi:6-phosphogluconolactonase/glucosamine-6-phosphate isomerase/deaminase
MTAPSLSSAGVGAFLITGAGKRGPLAALLGGEDIPASLMRPQRLVIIADREAAGAAG